MSLTFEIDDLPVEIVDRRAKLALVLGKHRDLREQFAEAALEMDEATLADVRARLADADEKIEAAYVGLRDATQRFGANVCAAIRSLLEEPEPAQQGI
jgi:hypothetical protein